MLAVEADLRARSAGVSMRVVGRGKVITCRLDGSPAGMFQTLRRSRELLAAARAAVPLLVRSGLRVEVVIGGVRVARAGSGVEQNALARLFKLPSAQLGKLPSAQLGA